jgi:uncharacterized membrane protein
MAKAKVLDDKVVITSEVLTNENIERVSILKPSVLILKDEEADKVLYEVTTGDCNSITNYGAIFKDGKAIAGISVDADNEEARKAKMKNIITSILVKIGAIEDQVTEYLDEAEAIEADVEFLD